MRFVELDSRRTELVVLTASGAAVIVATFLPWLRSGRLERSSYDLLGLVDRLDIAPDGVVSVLIRWWPVVPLLVTASVVLAWWDRRELAAVAALVATAYAGGVAVRMVVAARDTPVRLGPGPWACTVTSAIFLAASLWSVVSARRPALAAD